MVADVKRHCRLAVGRNWFSNRVAEVAEVSVRSLDFVMPAAPNPCRAHGRVITVLNI